MMKSIAKAMLVLLFLINAGCNAGDKTEKPANPILKMHADALIKAKQADRIIQEAAAKQREIIDAEGEQEQE
ncbi:MAG: hypothetical protein ACU84H_06085 [Gammaproteobacteria bacterium]